MSKEIFTKDEVIHGIPSQEAYSEIIAILEANGIEVHEAVKKPDEFFRYPHIVHMGYTVGATCASPHTGWYRWIGYSDFMNRVGRKVEKEKIETVDWREELSRQFNEKINNHEVHKEHPL